MLFFGMCIAFAERSVLPIAITRMVNIPNKSPTQNATAAAEPICMPPDWAIDQSDGTTIIDQAV